MVAAWPDRNWRIISYPYYTKDTTIGKSTGFVHLDINVEKFVDSGYGGNIIQGSVSLDDEDENGCTILVPRFHTQIRTWWERVRQRGLNHLGHTTNAKITYLPEDKRSFGKLMPVPCKRGAIRITRLEILHGSTSNAIQWRRVVFVWQCGIRDDHEMLDLEEAEQWSDLEEFLKAFPFVRTAEIRAYEARSFYQNLGRERPPPEEDASGNLVMNKLSSEIPEDTNKMCGNSAA
ncbi:MAG: hypothetical protein M1840_006680 [Geoglossum simile]|nr:MAG: hypothetical protein M1840_006680 [Geoglossum simile]